MSSQSATLIGSGTLPYTYSILDPTLRGALTGGRGERFGNNVVIINPEDLASSEAFAISGISIGTTPTLVWGPSMSSLARQRAVVLTVDGPGSLFFGPSTTSVIAPSGIKVASGASTPLLPFMKGVEIYGRSDSTTQIRILAY